MPRVTGLGDAIAEAMMRTLLIALSLMSAMTAPSYAASPNEVVAKFEALQKEMFKDAKGGAFDRFMAAERFTAREWGLGLEAAMHPPLNKPALAVLFEAYLWQSTKDMDPRDRTDHILAILEASEEPELLIRAFPALMEANVDARLKYFPIDGGDLDLGKKSKLAKRARAQLKTSPGDKLKAGRLRKIAAALEPDPEVLAAFVRANSDEKSVEGLGDNTSRLAHPTVLAAFLETKGNEAQGMATARLLFRLHHVESVPKSRRSEIKSKIDRVGRASKHKKDKDDIERLRRSMEEGQ